MDGENLFLNPQSRAHLRTCSGEQTEPPFFITHRPEDLLVRWETPAIVHVGAKSYLFMSVRFRQSWTYSLGVHAVIRLGLQPMNNGAFVAPISSRLLWKYVGVARVGLNTKLVLGLVKGGLSNTLAILA